MYKSKLQELCQKQRWELPKYDVSRHGLKHPPLFQATVIVNGSTFKSQELTKSSREAQNEAARAAFLHFTATSGVLSTNFNCGGDMPNNTSQTHNPENGGVKDVCHLYKNMLQNFAQKRELHLPVYTCEYDGPPHARRFKCKVIIDGKTFECSEFFSTIKDAEHAVAKVALTDLSPKGIGEEDSSFFKNLLQELAQKRACQMPVYSTTMSSEPHPPLFVSSVSVVGQMFEGQPAKTKKQAEISAAKVAFTTLNGSTPIQSATAPAPANQVTEVLDPSALCSTVNADPQKNGGPEVSPLHNSNSTSSDPAVTFRGSGCFDSQRLNSFPQPVMPDSHSRFHPYPQPKMADSPSQLDTFPQSVMADSPSWLHSVPQGPQPVMADSTSVLGSSPLPSEVSRSSASSAPHSSATINACCNLPADSGMSRNRVIVYPRCSNITLPPGSIVLDTSDDKYVAVKVVPSANQ